MYALTIPVGAGSSAIICGPCSAYQSASCAHFSTSASASDKIFPISVVMTFASCALFFLKVLARLEKSWARSSTGSLRKHWKLLSACATTSSVCAGVKNQNVSISEPVDGFTVVKPEVLMAAPFHQRSGPERIAQARSQVGTRALHAQER